MAKNKGPFSSFLDNPEAKKAVQDALHAPAVIPNQEAAAEPAVSEEAARPVETKKGKDEDGYQVITIRRSVHKLLKMASAHYGLEIREIASEAIAADPRVQNMLALLEKNKP